MSVHATFPLLRSSRVLGVDGIDPEDLGRQAELPRAATVPVPTEATYLAWLGYPGLSVADARRRERAERAVCAGRAIAAGTRRRDWPAGVRRLPNQQVVNGLNRLMDRLHTRRLPAARMALRLMERQVPSVREAAREWDDLRGPGAQEANVRARCWSESLPVLHLAIALPLGLLEPAPADTRALVASPGWAGEALRCAQLWRALLPFLVDSVRHERLIQFLPVAQP